MNSGQTRSPQTNFQPCGAVNNDFFERERILAQIIADRDRMIQSIMMQLQVVGQKHAKLEAELEKLKKTAAPPAPSEKPQKGGGK